MSKVKYGFTVLGTTGRDRDYCDFGLLAVAGGASCSRNRATRSMHQQGQADHVSAIEPRINYGSYPAGVPSCTHKNYITGAQEVGGFCDGPNWISNIFAQIEENELAHWVSETMDENASAVMTWSTAEAHPINLRWVTWAP